MDASNYHHPAIRQIVHDDIPWILSLAHERYSGWDPGGALMFLLQALKSPAMLMIRTDESFLIANHIAPPWYPKRRECHVMALCASTKQGAHWHALRLLRESIDWARLHECVRWRFYSETEYDVGALCRRVGASEETRYVLEL